MPKICPNCEAEITKLYYEVVGKIYGNLFLENEGENENDYEHEQTESEETGNDYIYTCPECDEEINLDDLRAIMTDEEHRERERERRTETEIVREEINRTTLSNVTLNNNPERNIGRLEQITEDNLDNNTVPEAAIQKEWKGEYSGFFNSHFRREQETIIKCPECGAKSQALGEEEIECYKCNKKYSKSSAKEITAL